MSSLAATPHWLNVSPPPHPDHTLPPFTTVETGLAAIDQQPPGDLSIDRLDADIRWLTTIERAAQARRARCLAERDRRKGDELSLSTARMLQDDLRLTESAAYGQIRNARRLEQLPATADAFRRGIIGEQHVDVICKAMAAVPKTRLLPDLTERSLLDKARRSNPHALHDHWLELRYRSDQEAAEIDEAEQRERRWLRLWRTRMGTFRIDGELDPVNGGLLRTALRSLMHIRSKDDERSHDQRRADAIGGLSRRLLDSGTLPQVAGEKPHLMLVATLETMRLEPGSPLAKLDWGSSVTGRTARRIAEDADITPVLVNQKGDILHVGRRSRVVPTRMRKLLNLRDGGCVEPSCTAPPEECQTHHLEHVVDGGRTVPSNMELRCDVHHQPVVHPENAPFWRRRKLTVVQPAGP